MVLASWRAHDEPVESFVLKVACTTVLDVLLENQLPFWLKLTSARRLTTHSKRSRYQSIAKKTTRYSRCRKSQSGAVSSSQTVMVWKVVTEMPTLAPKRARTHWVPLRVKTTFASDACHRCLGNFLVQDSGPENAPHASTPRLNRGATLVQW